jgi:TonB family protein
MHTYEWRWNFHPYDGDVRINDSAAAIVKRLRVAGGKADFAGEAELDALLRATQRSEPVFPKRLTAEVTAGEAVVEFFVDESGQAQLPRIVSASEPAFGPAACQAVAGWRYDPPRRNGKPTVVRMQVALSFRRD